MSDESRSFVPAAGVDWLLPLYDPLGKLLGTRHARAELIERAALLPGERVLDVGCGTGTLAVEIKRAHPEVAVTAIDPDAKALARARAKARAAGVEVRFEEAFGDALPFAERSFDRVVSSFMFHHLPLDARAGMLAEVERVLAPGGALLLLDFGGSQPHAGLLARWFHRHEHVAANQEGGIPTEMREAGLQGAREVSARHAWFGSIATWTGSAPT